MGLGWGECGILHVGGVFKRVEYFLAGEGLYAALKSLRLATIDHPVVISSKLSNIVQKNFQFLDIPKALN